MDLPLEALSQPRTAVIADERGSSLVNMWSSCAKSQAAVVVEPHNNDTFTKEIRRANLHMRFLFIGSLIVIGGISIAALVTIIGGLTTAYQNGISLFYVGAVRLRIDVSVTDCYQMLYVNSTNVTILQTGAADLNLTSLQLDLGINVLRYGNSSLLLTQTINTPNTTAIFEALTAPKLAFQSAAAIVANSFLVDQETYITAEVEQAIQQIISSSNQMNVLFSNLNTEYILDDLSQVTSTQTTEYAFMFVILGILIVDGLFAYFPLERRIRRMLGVLVKQNDNLNRLTDDLTIITKISPNGIFRTDKAGKIVYFNERFIQIIGLTDVPKQNEMNWLQYVHEDDQESVKSIWDQSLQDIHSSLTSEFRLIRPCDGRLLWILGQWLPETTSNARGDYEIKSLVGSFTDITERKALEQERVDALAHAAEVQQQRALEADQHRVEQERFVDMICHEIRNPLNGIVNNIDLLRTSQANIKEYIWQQKSLEEASKKHLFQDFNDEESLWTAIALCVKQQKRITDDVLHISRLRVGHFAIQNRTFKLQHTTDAVVHMFRAEAEKHQVVLTCSYSATCNPFSVLRSDSQRIAQILVNLLSNAIKFTRTMPTRTVNVSVDVVSANDAEKPDKVFLKYQVSDSGIGLTEEEQAKLFLPFRQANVKTYSRYGGSGMGLYINKALLDSMGGDITVQSQQGKGTTFSFQVPCTLLPDDSNLDSDDETITQQPTSFWPLRMDETATNKPSSSSSAAAAAAQIETNQITEQQHHQPPPPPPQHQQEQPQPQSQPQQQQQQQQQYRILVVEDNDINQRVLKMQLEAVKGKIFTVSVADNGQIALDMTKQEHFDLILMDVEMPVMDGLESTIKIREHEASLNAVPTLIIGLSGNARQEHVDRAMQTGMNDYIAKPYQRPALLACVARHLKIELN